MKKTYIFYLINSSVCCRALASNLNKLLVISTMYLANNKVLILLLYKIFLLILKLYQQQHENGSIKSRTDSSPEVQLTLIQVRYQIQIPSNLSLVYNVYIWTVTFKETLFVEGEGVKLQSVTVVPRVRFNNDNAEVTTPPAAVVVIIWNRYYDFPAIYHYHSYKVSLTNDLVIFDKLLMAIYLSSE